MQGPNSDVDERAESLVRDLQPILNAPSTTGRHGMALDEKTQTELEAAAFRRLLEHLRKRTDVQNIDMMNLAGFCRNCLSNWFEEAAASRGIGIARADAREMVYGMPQDEWKAKYQTGSNMDHKH